VYCRDTRWVPCCRIGRNEKISNMVAYCRFHLLLPFFGGAFPYMMGTKAKDYAVGLNCATADAAGLRQSYFF